MEWKIGSLFVEYAAKTDKYEQSLRQSEAMASRTADAIRKVSTFEVADPSAKGGGATVAIRDAEQQAARIGSVMRSALAEGLEPLRAIGPAIQASLAQVSRQLEAQLKFSKISEALTATHRRWTVDLDQMSDEAKRFYARMGQLSSSAFFHGTRKDTRFGNNGAGEASISSAATGSASRAASSIGSIGTAASGAISPVKSLGREMLTAFGFIGVVYEAVNGIKAMIGGAADLNEAINKTDVAFGGASASVKMQVDEMASAFGLPKAAMLDAASSIGLIGQGSGYSESEAAKLANTMTKLAADTMSLQNVPIEVALEKIRAGLVGEQEPLRAFGVNISEAKVEATALAMGLATSAKGIDEHSKMVARAAIISQYLGVANGDLANTIDAPKNAFRRFAGSISNLSVSIGQALTPAVETGMGMLNSFVASASNWYERNKSYFEGFGNFVRIAFLSVQEGASKVTTRISEMASRFSEWLGPISNAQASAFAQSIKDNVVYAIETVGKVIRNLPNYFDIAGIKISEAVTNIGEYIAVIPQNLAATGNYIANNWANLLLDTFNAIGRSIINLGKGFFEFGEAIGKFLKDPSKGFGFEWKGFLDGFKATADKLPELIRPKLTDMQNQIDAKLADIAKDEEDFARRTQQAATTPAQRQAKKDAASGVAGKEFKSETFELADFARSLAAKQRDEVPRQQLGELRKLNQISQVIADRLARRQQMAALYQ